ncbi:hypothetical protein BO78DRAFT_471598 [Aspergillus sclerotiicarbonarius CBS 121057]|uniref:Amine oxidase domain-containing protein n=1 Tax=Aspergillus sclerotiicarbonarius (strain CBS 121057 / IBT 28362) TaxID=1448318 RepID=A0A319E1P1_ASPSB|nr:hypothetical protein BO78DRAFT_471598 [Aspergillus sclerotiicarbonarius CBS 121057]
MKIDDHMRVSALITFLRPPLASNRQPHRQLPPAIKPVHHAGKHRHVGRLLDGPQIHLRGLDDIRMLHQRPEPPPRRVARTGYRGCRSSGRGGGPIWFGGWTRGCLGGAGGQVVEDQLSQGLVGGCGHGDERMYQLIEANYVSHHAYDWHHDPHAAGAFAFFGPAQFRHFYPELIARAADGHLLLAGEACSVHHAWIAGSIESAYRAVYQLVCRLVLDRRVPAGFLRRLEESWGCLREAQPEVLQWQVYLASRGVEAGLSSSRV